MLVLGMKPNEQICIKDTKSGQIITIRNYLRDIDSNRHRLAFDAPKQFEIYREKIK
jgi:sRNA-binding carbon storage regulator CsrA